jgi:hypothetical protein
MMMTPATGLASLLISILTDSSLREKLGLAALKSAQQHSVELTCSRLENLLYSSIAAGSELHGIWQHPLVLKTTQTCCLAAIEAANKI